MRLSVVRQTSVKAVELQALRTAIDGVDDGICRLLVTRRRLSREAIAMKVSAGHGVLDLQRERQIRLRYDAHGPGLARVAAAITQWCRDEN